MIESSTSLRFPALLHCLSHIWILVSTARRNWDANSLSRCSLALKLDLCLSIIDCRERRHWELTLSAVTKNMLLVMVNIFSWVVMSCTLVGSFTSCLIEALISSTVIPLPWVMMSWRRRWRFFCSSIRMGATAGKEYGLWLLGVLALDQRKNSKVSI